MQVDFRQKPTMKQSERRDLRAVSRFAQRKPLLPRMVQRKVHKILHMVVGA